MSTLQHTCTDCGHYERAHHQMGYAICGCCNHSKPWTPPLSAEPEITATYDAKTGKPERLYVPGSVYNSGNVAKAITCSCQACQDAYVREASAS